MVINIKLGFLKTSGLLLFSILMLTAGLFITLLLLLGALSKKLFLLSMKDILVMLLPAIFADFIGIMALYQWLRYNFGKEIITLNNKNKCLTYQQLVLNLGRTRVFNYSDITKIIGEMEYDKYSDYYSCCLIHQEKRFKFGMVNDIIEGKNIARRINDFLIR